MEIHLKDKKVRSEATQRQKLFSTLKTAKGRKIQKVKCSFMKCCTDHHLIKQTIQNAGNLKSNTLLEYSRAVRGNKQCKQEDTHVQTRRYTHVCIGEAAQHSRRTQNKRMRLFQLTSPVTNREPVSLQHSCLPEWLALTGKQRSILKQ